MLAPASLAQMFRAAGHRVDPSHDPGSLADPSPDRCGDADTSTAERKRCSTAVEYHHLPLLRPDGERRHRTLREGAAPIREIPAAESRHDSAAQQARPASNGSPLGCARPWRVRPAARIWPRRSLHLRDALTAAWRNRMGQPPLRRFAPSWPDRPGQVTFGVFESRGPPEGSVGPPAALQGSIHADFRRHRRDAGGAR